jgi:hypothetical protein
VKSNKPSTSARNVTVRYALCHILSYGTLKQTFECVICAATVRLNVSHVLIVGSCSDYVQIFGSVTFRVFILVCIPTKTNILTEVMEIITILGIKH